MFKKRKISADGGKQNEPDVRIQMEAFSGQFEDGSNDEEGSTSKQPLLLRYVKNVDQDEHISDQSQINNKQNNNRQNNNRPNNNGRRNSGQSNNGQNSNGRSNNGQNNNGQGKQRPKSLELDELEFPGNTVSAAKSVDNSLSKVVSRVMARQLCKKRLGRRNSATSDNHIVRLNTRLLDAIEDHKNEDVARILQEGANPNATCRGGHVSACHVAAYCNSRALVLLLEHNADQNRLDKFGRTPLHFAAWAGRKVSVAKLLKHPLESTERHPMVDVPCELSLNSVLHRSWQDSIEHKCRKYMSTLPKFFPGWTPLHVASYAAHDETAKLLLVAGANPNSKDATGLTPLDVVGLAYLEETAQTCKGEVDLVKYVETIKTLVKFGGSLNKMDKDHSTSRYALHTAVQLCSVEAIRLLLGAGASIAHRNPQGNTPLHECVLKQYKEPLQVLAFHCMGGTNQSIDVTDSIGYTVLQTAVTASWIPGVCIALDAGADVTFQANDGYTAIHLAARKGNLDILNEILNSVPYKNLDDLESPRVETPLFRAIRSGNLTCVKAIIDAGASLKLTTYHEPKLEKSPLLSTDEQQELNMIIHATAEVGHVEILEFLLNYDKDLVTLLDYRCPYLKNMLPVEFAALHNSTDTYKFLLHKTISRKKSGCNRFDPSRLLEILITKNRGDMFCDLLNLYPDVVWVSIQKGHYPLHEAIKHCDRNIILLVINNGGDLSQCDESGNTAISLFAEYRSKPTEFIASLFDTYIYPSDYSSIDNHHFEVVVDYCALLPTESPMKDERQMQVLEALLMTGNRDDQRKLLAHPLVESFLFLKWDTLSTFYYWLVFLYCLFVVSLSIYIVAVFYTIDKKENVPVIFNQGFWQYVMYISLGIIVIQELSCTTLIPKSWRARLHSRDFWVKICVYSLAFATPFVITVDTPDMEWLRHLASLTMVLAWLMFSLLLSKAPLTGYYMQMFWNVSQQIIGILLSFVFLIVFFSLCFMIEFHFKVPFDGPWAAVVKTLVMMTSEFDYGGTFTNETALSVSTSIQMLRVIFVVFLVFTAIVLMNLMTGIAVHDVQSLILDGNLRRLDKQVGFLSRLEISRGRKSFLNIMGMYRMLPSKKVPRILKMNPAKDDGNNKYRQYIKQSLMNKAQEKMVNVNKEEKLSDSKFDELLQAFKATESNLLSQINELKTIVNQLKKPQKQHTLDSACSSTPVQTDSINGHEQR